jgi:hypothetical protein
MNELFANQELENEMMEKFAKLFDKARSDTYEKAVDLYLSVFEEYGIEMDIASILNLAEEYDISLENFEEEISQNM